jgi:hypothetical protein
MTPRIIDFDRFRRGRSVMAEAELIQVLEGAREVELTVTGRRSGEESSRPVWFAQDGERMYLVPVGGSGSNWYRNILQTPRIRLVADGVELETEATPITDAPVMKDVLGKFGEKYGDSQVKQYYPDQDVAVEISLA